MTRNRLYSIVLIACFFGLVYVYIKVKFIEDTLPGVCLFKNLTTIPCPSCGSTRAVMELLKGNFITSICINPFGIVLTLVMAIIPLWIVIDLMRKKSTFHSFYKKTETLLKQPKVYSILILVVIINWIWNIIKHQ